ncbi:MAP kinase kinase PBS2 [Spathaspora sp. JA1]|nr:MAP kinase kinase PBS2 [Spathaspora sp. JA1]
MSHNSSQSMKEGRYSPEDLPIEKLNIDMSTNSSVNTVTSSTSSMHRPISSPPITPSSHSHLNSDIQARLVAFQQKRTKLGSEANNSTIALSSPPITTSSSSSSNSGNCSREELSRISPLEKPLPPLPESTNPRDNVKRSLSTNDKYTRPVAGSGSERTSGNIVSSATSLSGSNSSPILPSYSIPTRGNSTGSRLSSLSSPKIIPAQIDLMKKPSLSQRRGMKLNVGDLAIGSTTNKSPSPRMLSPPVTFGDDKSDENKSGGDYIAQAPIASQLGTPGELSRRLSERKKKPHFKLNLDSINSDLPSLSRSSSLNRSNPTTSSSEGINSESERNSNGEQQQLHGLFANYSNYVDIKSGQLNFAGKASLHSEGVDFSSGSSFRISIDELEYIGELGRGNYGSVSKVLHRPTGVLMAMKEVRLELDETKFMQILMELDILHKCNSPYIVDFYGAFFVEGAVYMCIEYMDGGSLDKIFGNNIGVKDECTLAYITESVVRGLKELKDKHNIIHRDVKPTNILVNSQGNVKLCDFGVSGNLVASLAKTNIGCQSYMAPERIRTLRPDDATYSVQSDVWSLGLTMLELAVGHYPYPSETYGNIFSQLSAIVDGEPPSLDPEIYSTKGQEFVKACLNKKPELRPSYAELVDHPWLQEYRGKDPHLDITVKKRLVEIENENLQRSNKVNSNNSMKVANLPMQNIENVQSLLRSKVKAPALHRGGLQTINRSFLNNDK